MITERAVISDEELMALPRDGHKRELVDGEIICMSPAGMDHGRIIVRLTILLGQFVRQQKLGQVFDSSTGYRLPSGNLRSPDLSFVASGRLPAGRVTKGFGTIAPDLAVEVLSPSDSPRRVLDGIGEYLASGVRMVWVIDPETRCAVEHRSLSQVREVPEGGVLDGGDVVPGFAGRLAELFEDEA